jgi:hypothetical protein
MITNAELCGGYYQFADANVGRVRRSVCISLVTLLHKARFGDLYLLESLEKYATKDAYLSKHRNFTIISTTLYV